MRVWIAERLDPREVFEGTLDLLAVERLVNAKPVRIPVQEGNRLVITL